MEMLRFHRVYSIVMPRSSNDSSRGASCLVSAANRVVFKSCKQSVDGFQHNKLRLQGLGTARFVLANNELCTNINKPRDMDHFVLRDAAMILASTEIRIN